MQTGERSRLVHLFDAFLQEHNIKWVLGIGTAILLGSSLMLVGNQWAHYTPVWKFVVMLAYTAGVFAGSQWAYHRMQLQRTGTVLMGLTTLLVPVLLAALNWVGLSPVAEQTVVGSVGSLLTTVTLFSATMALAIFASGRVFRHFLRGEQTTFRVSYLFLAGAGAVAPTLPAALAPLTALILWGAFTAGAVKVTRHVFWLVEEHRAPRVVGFFPVMLLAAQFLLVFVFACAPHLDPQWIGLGLALVAVSVLAVTDGVAEVFKRRTGDLVRPLPAAIVTPLVVGLGLCVAAFAVAALGFATQPYAMVPTAVVITVAMVFVARRTGRSAFVWAAIGAGLIAYNFSPVFFAQLARQLIHAGASAVSEERLPYAFYGLTYLPVIASLTALAAWARRRALSVWERPFRLASLALAVGLLVVSITHAKAVLPVAAAMIVVFAVHLVVYRERLCAIFALGATVLALTGVAPFFATVVGSPLSVWTVLSLFAGLNIVLLGAGARLDSWIDGFRKVDEQRPWRLLERAGAVLAPVLAVAWLVALMGTPLTGVGAHIAPLRDLLVPGVIAALLGAYGVRWRNPILGMGTLVFVHLATIAALVRGGVGPEVILTGTTLALLVQGWAGALALRRSDHAISETFARPAWILSTIALSIILVLGHLPVAFMDMVRAEPQFRLDVPWLVRALAILWTFDASRRARSIFLGGLATVATLALTGAVVVRGLGAGLEWLPLAWSLATGAFLAALLWVRNRQQTATDEDVARGWRALAVPFRITAHGVWLAVAVGSLFVWTAPLRFAGLAAVAGLWAMWRARESRSGVPAILSQWQLLAMLGFMLTPVGIDSLGAFLSSPAPTVALTLGAAAAVLGIIVPLAWPQHGRFWLAGLNRLALIMLAAGAVVWSLFLPSLAWTAIVPAITIFALFTFDQLYRACRNGESWRVWLAELIAGLAVAYLAGFRVIHFGRGFSMFIVTGLAFAFWGLSHLVSRHERTKVMAGPFGATAMVFPIVTVGIALFRHTTGAGSGWLGLNSMALMLAAGFYFWLAIERGWKRLYVAAAAILNIAVMLLWNRLSWTDPQLYMIPAGLSVLALTRLLRAEIPERLREPLYYLGALVILVSPTFNIVTGSWVHLLSLMVSSVVMVFVAIGLRLRALLYVGSAFLMADLVAIVVRGSVDNPSVLWLAGLALGALVITLGALAERNRELLMQRLRMLSAELESWAA